MQFIIKYTPLINKDNLITIKKLILTFKGIHLPKNVNSSKTNGLFENKTFDFEEIWVNVVILKWNSL